MQFDFEANRCIAVPFRSSVYNVAPFRVEVDIVFHAEIKFKICLKIKAAKIVNFAIFKLLA